MVVDVDLDVDFLVVGGTLLKADVDGATSLVEHQV
jgi:hypothetical protein